MKRFPVVTLTLCVLVCSLMLLPVAAQEALYFDFGEWLQGRVRGLLSGHWIHADMHHLAWNVVALGILGVVLEQRSRCLLGCSVMAGILFVDLMLLSPFSTIQRYCGLSGLLNTLLGVVLYLFWQETRSVAVVLVGTLSLSKIAVELGAGQSLFTDISWPPFPLAHLAGILGAPVAIWCFHGVCRVRGYRPLLPVARGF